MRPITPDTRIYDELQSLNAAFLQVLVSQDPHADAAVTVASAAITAQLRLLDDDGLDFIAGTPALLAEFSPPEPERAEDTVEPNPRAGLFAVALLTWFWKTDRHDQLAAALCVSPAGAGSVGIGSAGSGSAGTGPAGTGPALSIRLIERHAAQASRQLRIRFAEHPRFWADLIRAARGADPDLRMLARLTALPLIVAGAPGDRNSGEPSPGAVGLSRMP